MISQRELDDFYEGVVTAVRDRGGACVITSGMACVQYGGRSIDQGLRCVV